MNKKELKKYLGGAIYLIYYFHERLHQSDTIELKRWEELTRNKKREFWIKTDQAMRIAMSEKDYMLNDLKSPYLEIYTRSDIQLFFRKLHEFLTKWLAEEEE